MLFHDENTVKNRLARLVPQNSKFVVAYDKTGLVPMANLYEGHIIGLVAGPIPIPEEAEEQNELLRNGKKAKSMKMYYLMTTTPKKK